MQNNSFKNNARKTLLNLALKSAKKEANSACALWGYQPKEPLELKELRKF